ncbi:MAG: hypothetical protein ACR65Z_12450 [Methylocystis sp.]|jgi:hypothetical protein
MRGTRLLLLRRRAVFTAGALVLAGLFLAGFAASAVAAANYEFLAAPQTDLNRVFRLDRSNGEVGACQYGLKEGAAIGVTLCYPPGEGARAGVFSEYALVASRHTGEGGVFRVDLRSGMMSICFVLNETSVVCTPPAK